MKQEKYIRVKGVRWFTYLDYKERHEDIILCKQPVGGIKNL
ncbi:adenine-specific methyltransferase EcoRI family protein [Prevotella sp. MGM1]|nr:adenine-specific methyltransferase EcoRI family protein [Prevotella sp. MGM1]GAY26748.1 modification methylase [Prevotella sp. MGM1]